MRLLNALFLILTLNCEQSSRLVSDALDRDLSWSERLAVRSHHLCCRSCRRLAKQIAFITRSAEEWSRDSDADAADHDWAAAKERIAKRIRRTGS